MPLEPVISALVLLAGADASAVESLQPAAEILEFFTIPTHTLTVSHGEPFRLDGDAVCAIIVASPDAALPAALAAQTVHPVIRVPTAGGGLRGAGCLNDGHGNLPAGPASGIFATMAIGEAGAKNAALFVVSSLAGAHPPLRAAWAAFRDRQTAAVLKHPPLE